MSNPFYLQRKANKYGASKTVFQGRLYDSKGEAGLAVEIDILLKSGLVVKVEPQVTFKLYGKNGGKSALIGRISSSLSKTAIKKLGNTKDLPQQSGK